MIWLAVWLGCSNKDDGRAPDGRSDADAGADADTDTDTDADSDTEPTPPAPTGTLTLDWTIGLQTGGKTCAYGDGAFFPSWPSIGTIWSLDCTGSPDFGFFATHQPEEGYAYTADEVHVSLVGDGVDTTGLAIASQSVTVEEVDSTIPSVRGSFLSTFADGSTLAGSFDTDLLP